MGCFPPVLSLRTDVLCLTVVFQSEALSTKVNGLCMEYILRLFIISAAIAPICSKSLEMQVIPPQMNSFTGSSL